MMLWVKMEIWTMAGLTQMNQLFSLPKDQPLL